MRALVQRATRASVTVEGETIGAIEWRDAWTITDLGRSVLASGLFAAASPSER